MKNTGYAIGSLLLAAAVLAGCAGVAAPAGGPAGREASVVNPSARAESKGAAWLTEREWTISGFNTGSQFVPLEPGHGGEAWLYFSADGTLNGFTGTNTFRGTWKLGAKNSRGAYPLVVSVGPMTKKAATNEIAARFEMTFLNNLQKSVALSAGKSTVDLSGSSGDRLLAFVFLGPPGGE